MITHRKTQIILALMLASVFLFQNCATLGRGTSQKIPVTSSPGGAKIIVDGEETGYAPLELKLKRKKKLHVIRVESPGYNPLEIRITRKASPGLSILVNMIWGGLGFFAGAIAALPLYLFSGDEDKGPALAYICMIGGAISWWGGAILKDFKSGANYTLSPEQLNVTLEKQEGKPQPEIILLDARQFRNIKWLRIRCAYSGGEDS